MPNPNSILILDGTRAENDWIHLSDDADAPEQGRITVSLARLQRDGARLIERQGELGVRLASGDDVAELAPLLSGLSLVAIDLPKFADGRCFSMARLLRERYQWSGELRAVGAVLVDQLFYMTRCGINAFELEPGQNPETAMRLIPGFSVKYQAAIDLTQPLYRRRSGDPANLSSN